MTVPDPWGETGGEAGDRGAFIPGVVAEAATGDDEGERAAPTRSSPYV